MHTKFYDEDGLLVNTMNSYEVQMMSSRLIPTRFEMIPTDKKNQRTEMKYNTIEFDPILSDGFFSIETMRMMP